MKSKAKYYFSALGLAAVLHFVWLALTPNPHTALEEHLGLIQPSFDRAFQIQQSEIKPLLDFIKMNIAGNGKKPRDMAYYHLCDQALSLAIEFNQIYQTVRLEDSREIPGKLQQQYMLLELMMDSVRVTFDDTNCKPPFSFVPNLNKYPKLKILDPDYFTMLSMMRFEVSNAVMEVLYYSSSKVQNIGMFIPGLHVQINLVEPIVIQNEDMDLALSFNVDDQYLYLDSIGCTGQVIKYLSSGQTGEEWIGSRIQFETTIGSVEPDPILDLIKKTDTLFMRELLWNGDTTYYHPFTYYVQQR
jgi:hypothetical protein